MPNGHRGRSLRAVKKSCCKANWTMVALPAQKKWPGDKTRPSKVAMDEIGNPLERVYQVRSFPSSLFPLRQKTPSTGFGISVAGIEIDGQRMISRDTRRLTWRLNGVQVRNGLFSGQRAGNGSSANPASRSCKPRRQYLKNASGEVGGPTPSSSKFHENVRFRRCFINKCPRSHGSATAKD